MHVHQLQGTAFHPMFRIVYIPLTGSLQEIQTFSSYSYIGNPVFLLQM